MNTMIERTGIRSIEYGKLIQVNGLLIVILAKDIKKKKQEEER